MGPLGFRIFAMDDESVFSGIGLIPEYGTPAPIDIEVVVPQAHLENGLILKFGFQYGPTNRRMKKAVHFLESSAPEPPVKAFARHPDPLSCAKVIWNTKSHYRLERPDSLSTLSTNENLPGYRRRAKIGKDLPRGNRETDRRPKGHRHPWLDSFRSQALNGCKKLKLHTTSEVNHENYQRTGHSPRFERQHCRAFEIGP